MADKEDEKGLEEEIDEKGGNGAGEGGEGAQNGSEGGSGTDEGDGEGEGEGKGKTFTQEDVNRMMAKEKRQGRNSAFNELGINPKDEKTIEQFKLFAEFMKSSKQTGGGDGGNDGANSAELLEIQSEKMNLEIQVEAMKQGIKKEYVDDIATLVRARIADEDTDVKTVIGEYRTKFPDWFGSDDGDEGGGKKGGTGQRGTGKSMSKGASNKGKENDLGARLAANRKKSVKSSFWDV